MLILWIIDGFQRLRVHSGICYLYLDKGSFETYHGLPSEHIFHRIKAFLLILEGMFRLLNRETQRTDDGMWNAMVSTKNDCGSELEWYKKCTDAAIFSSGSRRRAGAGKGGEDEAPEKHWIIYTAESISVVALKMQSALLDGKLMTYVIEWCETESTKNPGVAYTGVSVLYDRWGSGYHNSKACTNQQHLHQNSTSIVGPGGRRGEGDAAHLLETNLLV